MNLLQRLTAASAFGVVALVAKELTPLARQRIIRPYPRRWAEMGVVQSGVNPPAAVSPPMPTRDDGVPFAAARDRVPELRRDGPSHQSETTLVPSDGVLEIFELIPIRVEMKREGVEASGQRGGGAIPCGETPRDPIRSPIGVTGAAGEPEVRRARHAVCRVEQALAPPSESAQAIPGGIPQGVGRDSLPALEVHDAHRPVREINGPEPLTDRIQHRTARVRPHEEIGRSPPGTDEGRGTPLVEPHARHGIVSIADDMSHA